MMFIYSQSFYQSKLEFICFIVIDFITGFITGFIIGFRKKLDYSTIFYFYFIFLNIKVVVDLPNFSKTTFTYHIITWEMSHIIIAYTRYSDQSKSFLMPM
ncbi:hypothetical protein C2G38_2127962 [Gigaspora rosea]|uniref:Uncharacterized protein n=1 Tax=Gigaspora rosea TaxID=44941 RepID=A0A397TWJ3_9GLOM|nr:hypothetical protein C2G38_2127962 [Gigaspora rosea]